MAVSKQNDAPAPSVGDYDADTQEILREMHKEGFDVGVPGLEAPQGMNEPEPPAPAPAPVENAEPENEPEGEGGEPEDISPVGGEPPAPAPRSVAEERKNDYWREKARDTEAALEEARKKLEAYEQREAFAHVDEKIDEVAKKHGVSAAVIKDILTLGKDAFVPPELKQAMTDIQSEREAGRFWDDKFSQFDHEFEVGLLPVLQAENPNITQQEVNKIYAQLGGADRNGPAWADENSETPLVSLYYRLVKPTQQRASSESNRVRSRGADGAGVGAGGAVKTLDQMQPGELNAMSDDEFDTYSEGLRTVQPKLKK